MLAARCGDLDLQVMALLGQASMYDVLGNEALLDTNEIILFTARAATSAR